MADTQTLHGLDGFLVALKKLPPEIGSKGGGPARKALRKGAMVIRDEAERRAPEDTGNLRDSIVTRRDPKPHLSHAAEVYWVGVKGGGRRKYANTKRNRRNRRTGQEYEVSGNAYYWRFIEFGFTRANGDEVAAQPFLRPAFNSKKQEALDVIVLEMTKGIDKAVRKVARQNRKR